MNSSHERGVDDEGSQWRLGCRVLVESACPSGTKGDSKLINFTMQLRKALDERVEDDILEVWTL